MVEVFGYSEDLSFIHDIGFSDFSINASKALLSWFEELGIINGRIVELGCGSGTLSSILYKRGFNIFGIDITPSMIKLAKQKVPEGIFVQGSIWEEEIPKCDVVLSIGECLNYEFDGPINNLNLESLFSRVYNAISSKGLFIFDVLCECDPIEKLTKNFTEGNGWLVAVEREETYERLSRKIISFREIDSNYFRKTSEVHKVHKYNTENIIKRLEEVGFSVKIMEQYGDFNLRTGHKVILSHKL